MKQAARSDEGRVRAGRTAERVQFQRRLANAPGQRSDRNDRGLGGTQVEGRQAVRELLIAGKRRVRELWIANDLSDAEVIGDIVDLANDQRVPIVEVNRKRLDAEARSESPQGVLARADELEAVEFEELLKRKGPRPPFLVALDGVTDPGNLGAVLRSADGAGVSGVLLPKHRAVHITPTAAKSAAGAVEHLNIAVVPGLPAALARCRQAGLWVVGLDDAADRSLFDLGDLAADAVVLVLGAEGAGLSRLARERCDLIVSIPMLGRLSSLNVSNAGALALYEIARQRALKAASSS
jgi:23S rRNA (guanosine2251-2'-O)-methyltransferase